GTTLQWIKRYMGRYDDVYTVEAALGYDGRNCRGFITYSKSKFRAKLDGTLLGPNLKLEERDEKAPVTATLQGKLENNMLALEWVNQGNTVGSHLEMTEIGPTNTPVDFCGADKWVNRYVGAWKGKPMELVLVRLHNGDMSAQLWNSVDNNSENLKGSMTPNGDLTLESYPEPGKPLFWLESNIRSLQSIRCDWTSSNGEMRTIEFTLRESLTMGCVEYADFVSSYDILYPNTSCTGCNQWFSQQITNWTNRCKSAIQSKKLTPVPANRNALRASMWPEVSCWSDGIFSGYLNYSDTWSGPAQGLAFNLDLKTGKPILLEDLFQKDFDFKSWVNEYMRKESPKNPRFAADPKFREWLYAEGYPLFTLRRDGIKISTLFHPIYGQQHLLIPYAELKPFLLPNTPITEFVPK
ncbi:MAG TPA: hypothetical protein PKL15_18830, partial [Saprospiraceae bacterium]|nr:hypothetical protein [Saprospiraceae bacterium]